MDIARVCIDTGPLFAFLKGREPEEQAARHAAKLHDELIRRNEDIGIKDVLIAAICLEHDLPLLTLNERHFHRVRGLSVLTPTEILS